MAQTSLAVSPFLDESRDIASSYVNLCLKQRDEPLERSPGPRRSLESRGPPPIDGTVQTPAERIAERLKRIGDSIDDKVKEELTAALFDEMKLHPSVYQLDPERFTNLCRRVLTKCACYINSGWEQATVVFMGVTTVVQALRGDSRQYNGQREAVVTGFAGEALQELALDTWISQHGGMIEFGGVVKDGQLCVPMEGTPV